MNTITTELETTAIPLQKLLAWKDNVRTTKAEEGIEELAASIASHGLLHNLVVKKESRGKFSVIAGRRRLLALSQLVEAGTIRSNHAVPCRVITSEADLTEVSLAENVMREPMHPADEFEAFQRLIEKGHCVADVAARFGVTEAVVQRRLALARVSPALLAHYRQGEINLELLQAFTLTDDHARQKQLWRELKPWERDAATIRRLLSQEDLSATDKRVRFVGLSAYEAAGGGVKRDLFAKGEEGAYLLDPALLHRLVNEKLELLAEEVKTKGWKWVEIQPDTDHQIMAQYRRLYAPEAPWSPEEEAQVKMLETERATIESQLPEDEEDSEACEPLYTRLEKINEAIQSLRQNRKRVYSEDTKAHCGVVIHINFHGQPEYIRGLVRKEDENALAQTRAGDDGQSPVPLSHSADSEKEASPYSASLLETLTTHKTAALAAELTQQPNIALAAVVYTLALQDFGLDLHCFASSGSLQLSSRVPSLAAAEGSPACLFLEEQRQAWLTQLPDQPNDLWSWCLQQDQETLLRLLAFCAARSVNGIQAKADYQCQQRLTHANALGKALHIDMAQWFTPTADNFFSKISKAHILQVLAEAGKPLMADTASIKKAELAARAETQIRRTGWLPEPIRIAECPPQTVQHCALDHPE